MEMIPKNEPCEHTKTRNIFLVKEKGIFFLCNWAILLENPTSGIDLRTLSANSLIDPPPQTQLNSQIRAEEIRMLALVVLKMVKREDNEIKYLQGLQPDAYEIAANAIISETFQNSEKLQNLLSRM